MPRNVNAPAPVAPDNNRPQDVARVPIEIALEAKMFPWNIVPPLIVASWPTNHQTLDALAPPVRIILLLTAVVIEEGAWKVQTSVALPLSVRSPVTLIVEPVEDI